MEREPFVDTRIMDLAPMYIGRATYARRLAQIQSRTWRNTGHLLAYNDEYVWRRLKEGRDSFKLPDLRVRCMRCYAVASLKDWDGSCWLEPDQRARILEGIVSPQNQRSFRFMRNCEGANQSEEVLLTLDTLCEVTGSELADHESFEAQRG